MLSHLDYTLTAGNVRSVRLWGWVVSEYPFCKEVYSVLSVYPSTQMSQKRVLLIGTFWTYGIQVCNLNFQTIAVYRYRFRFGFRLLSVPAKRSLPDLRYSSVYVYRAHMLTWLVDSTIFTVSLSWSRLTIICHRRADILCNPMVLGLIKALGNSCRKIFIWAR